MGMKKAILVGECRVNKRNRGGKGDVWKLPIDRFEGSIKLRDENSRVGGKDRF